MSPAVRLSLFYGAGAGALTLLPYMSVVLGDQGLSDRQISLSLALVPIGLLVGGPLWSWAADRTRAPNAVLVTATLITLAAGIWMGFAHSGLALSAGLVVYAISRSSQFPLADVMVLRHVPDGSTRYGQIRAWGSVVFVLVVATNGIARGEIPRAPIYIATAFMALTALVALGLPKTLDPPARPSRQDLRQLIASPVLRSLVGVAVLHGITVTAYDNFFVLHMERLGFSAAQAGLGISVGVSAEVAVLMSGPWLIRVLGPRRLLLLAVAAGIPRWLLTGMATDATVLILTQSLHGLMFGGFWAASIHIVADHAPERLMNSAQTLVPTATFGVGYLFSMTLAAAVLPSTTTGRFFVGMVLLSSCAVLAAVGAGRRISEVGGR